MITFVRTHTAMPGKLVEVIEIGKELTAIIKQLTGRDRTLATAVGGNGAEIARIGRVDNLAAYEEITTKSMADAKYRAVTQRLSGLLVPGSLHDQIWRQV